MVAYKIFFYIQRLKGETFKFLFILLKKKLKYNQNQSNTVLIIQFNFLLVLPKMFPYSISTEMRYLNKAFQLR